MQLKSANHKSSITIDCYNIDMWLRETKPPHRPSSAGRYVCNSALATVGYILSPLSWWNDVVVNIPLAYLFSIPFSLLSERLFMPTFVLGYWLTNLLGFILMHKGIAGVASKTPAKLNWRIHGTIALVYTLAIVGMVWAGWVPMPTDLIQHVDM